MSIQQSQVSGDIATAAAIATGELTGLVLPSWLPAVGEWGALPNSTMTTSGAGWSGSAPGGTGNYQAIVLAWGGGILNTTGVTYGGSFIPGTFLVIFGGGHGDYGGNELYCFGPLESGSPIWRRLTDPTIPAPNDVARSGTYPCSRHTYDTLVYLPSVNKMLCIGAAGYYSIGFARNQGDLFDFSVDPAVSSPWTGVDAGFPSFTGGGTIALMSDYDTASGLAWGIGNGNASKLVSFDPGSNTWASYYKDNPNAPGSNKAAVAPSLQLLAFVNGSTVYAQSLAAPNSAVFAPSCTGVVENLGASSLEWDAVTGKFVVKAPSGKKVYYLTPGANPVSDAWAWSSDAPASGATPPDNTPNGVYGRFRLMNGAGFRGLVYMPGANQPIYFYRLA